MPVVYGIGQQAEIGKYEIMKLSLSSSPHLFPMHAVVGGGGGIVFTLNRSFYPTSSAVHPVSVLRLNPREIQILWSQTVRQEKTCIRTINVYIMLYT